MRGGVPSDLRFVNLGVIASAVANAVTQGVILGIPGPGFRYRIWCVFVNTNLTTQAPLNWQVDFRDNPFTIAYGRIAHSGFNDSQLYWPGGYALLSNVGTQWTVQSSLASLNLGITMGYTIEVV